MPHREFKDSDGRHWDVWTVVPAFAERRRPGGELPAGVQERRRHDEFRVSLGGKWANGWLAFATQGERRRLLTFPTNWEDLSDAELEALCKRAQPASRRRRLVE